MAISSGRDLNENAYRQLKEAIGRDYPHGRFVAIDGGNIIADAADVRQLRKLLDAMGRPAREVLVVEAGVDYPEYVEILASDQS